MTLADSLTYSVNVFMSGQPTAHKKQSGLDSSSNYGISFTLQKKRIFKNSYFA